ncbi:hypothetical protein QQ020_11315 [Fulvivirgaceae bacterium BMA12]|uniref:Uncharacterized protein n=1 Tax=Agaribacillus aureus TaxID=3051825 RepID=A0ABT8L5W9_9BACT|nr:hypothetical protein [Fulvivirgaceae bacterium BMA12]
MKKLNLMVSTFTGFNSDEIGSKICYSPLYGVTRFKGSFIKKENGITRQKSMDLNYANYAGFGGPDANLVSLDFAFKF